MINMQMPSYQVQYYNCRLGVADIYETACIMGSSFLVITDISNNRITTTIVPCNYTSNKMGNNKSTNCLINTVIFCINFFN